MKIIAISDTHGRHEELGVLSGEVLIHCGDSGNGFRREDAEVTRSMPGSASSSSI